MLNSFWHDAAQFTYHANPAYGQTRGVSFDHSYAEKLCLPHLWSELKQNLLTIMAWHGGIVSVFLLHISR